MTRFSYGRGYANAASWPGDAATTEATRKNADAVAGYGVTSWYRTYLVVAYLLSEISPNARLQTLDRVGTFK